MPTGTAGREHFRHEAERILHGELSAVLGMNPREVIPFLQEKLLEKA